MGWSNLNGFILYDETYLAYEERYRNPPESASSRDFDRADRSQDYTPVSDLPAAASRAASIDAPRGRSRARPGPAALPSLPCRAAGPDNFDEAA